MLIVQVTRYSKRYLRTHKGLSQMGTKTRVYYPLQVLIIDCESNTNAGQLKVPFAVTGHMSDVINMIKKLS